MVKYKVKNENVLNKLIMFIFLFLQQEKHEEGNNDRRVANYPKIQ